MAFLCGTTFLFSQNETPENEMKETLTHVESGLTGSVVYNADDIRLFVEGFFGSLKNLTPDENDVFLNFIRDIFKRSGIEEIAAYKAVSIKNKDDNSFILKKFITPFSNSPKSGIIWDIFGREKHDPAILNFIPDDTFFAASLDINGEFIVQNIIQLLSDNPDAIDERNYLAKKIKGDLNIELPHAVSSIQSITIAVGGGPDNRLAPGIDNLTIIMETKNPYIYLAIFDCAKEKAQDRIINNGILLFPEIKGTLIQIDNYFIFSTEPDRIRDLIRGKGASLAASDDFIKHAEKLPQKANGFIFLSEKSAPVIKIFIEKISQQLRSQHQVDVAKFTKFIGLESGVYGTIAGYENGIYAIATTKSLPLALMNTSEMGCAVTMSPLFISLFGDAVTQSRRDYIRQKDWKSLQKVQLHMSNQGSGLAAKLMLYKEKNQNALPLEDGAKGLQKIIDSTDSDFSILVLPDETDVISGTKGTPLTEENTSFVYLGGVTKDYPDNFPVIFLKPASFSAGLYTAVIMNNGNIRTFLKGSEKPSVSNFAEAFMKYENMPDEYRQILRDKVAKIDGNKD